MRRLSLLALALLAQAPASTAETARGTKLFLWKATSATTEVYLFGSIHLGKKEFYPLAKEIEGAFEKSKFLVLEADESKTEAAALQQMVFAKGLYAPDDALSKHVPAETFKAAVELAESLGIPAASVERFKPWLLAMSVSVMAVQKLGYSPELGIDRHFLQEAKTAGKEVLELESMDFQIKMLAGFPDELQAKFLASTVDEAANVKERMGKIVDAWSKADLDGFEKETLREPRQKHPEQAELHAKLIDDRNVGMVVKIGGYLKTKDVHFVVVGAAHLVGEKGVVRLLEKDGFKVTQVEAP